MNAEVRVYWTNGTAKRNWTSAPGNKWQSTSDKSDEQIENLVKKNLWNFERKN